MLSLLVTIAMFAPMATGGHGNHFGWRNKNSRPPTFYEQVTPPTSNTSSGSSNTSGTSTPEPGPLRFAD